MVKKLTRKERIDRKKRELKKSRKRKFITLTFSTIVLSNMLASKAFANVDVDVEYTVRDGDTLSKIAKQNGISVEDLKRINDLNSNVIFTGQTLQTIDLEARVSQTRNLTENNKAVQKYKEYKVQPGDTLSIIAILFNTTVDVIKKTNGFKDDTIYVGQPLLIKDNSNEEVGITVKDKEVQKYKVQPGDTLSVIAILHNTTIDAIKKANGLKDDTIYVDQILYIDNHLRDIRGTMIGSVDTTSIAVDVNGQEEIFQMEYGNPFDLSDFFDQEVKVTYKQVGDVKYLEELENTRNGIIL